MSCVAGALAIAVARCMSANASFTRFLSLDTTADNGGALLLRHQAVIALRDERDDILRRAQPPTYRRSLHRLRDALSAIEARMRTHQDDSPGTCAWMDAIAVVQETH
jgi:hypothetical protein